MKKISLGTLIAFFAILSMGLQSCSSLDPAKLEGKKWVLRTMNGNDAKTLFEGPIPTLELNFTDSLATGTSGCNRYFGKFSLKGNNFSMPNAAGTLMACPWANQEGEFLKLLSSKEMTLVMENDNTIHFKHDGKNVLHFSVETQDDINYNEQVLNAPVVRRKSDLANQMADKETVQGEWVLTKIADANIDEMYKDRIPTINFNAEGHASGNSGCNTYRTSYTFEGNVITFTPLLSTRMACPDNMEGENLYVQTLSKPFEVYKNNADNALLFFEGDKLVLEYVKK